MERRTVEVSITPNYDYGWLTYDVMVGGYTVGTAPPELLELSEDERYKAVVHQIGTWMLENGYSTLTPEVISLIEAKTWIF